MKRFVLCLLAVIMAFQITCKAELSIDSVIESTAAYLKDAPTISPGNSESDWSAIALCIAKKDFDKQSYEKKLSEYVKNKYSESSLLSASKATEWHRIALSVTALGENAENFNGINLLSDGVFDRGRLEKQGINAYIWALITVNAVGNDDDVSFLIDKIISSQNEDGGFSLSGKNSDVDVTSMAICALAPYREKGDVLTAVNRAVLNLSSVQNEDGGFSSWGTANSESTAQVMVALSALSIDPDKDEMFVKSGGSALSALLKYWTGEGFSHTYGGDNNTISSYQSLIALCAYKKGGYIYSLAPDKKAETKTEKTIEVKEEKTEAAEKIEATEETEEQTVAVEEMSEEESESETDLNENYSETKDYTLPIAGAIVIIIIIASATIFIIRRKHYVEE